ncbi:MAG: hypothetical protein V4502_01920 [Pseudomonadota bacterium]
MTSFIHFAGAAALVAGLAAPAAAQYQQYPQPYPQQYPQTYPQQYPQTYPQQYPQTSPGYQQGYGANPIQQVIDSLLGNRYNVTDRQAISSCASAATVQAQAQYRGYGQQGYGAYGQQGHGGHNGYPQQGIVAPTMRVTAITDVQRRSSGLRVKGLISSGYGGYGQQGHQNGYGQNGYGQNGYQNPAYGAGDLAFRCTVDYRGAVTNIRISSNANPGYRRY